MEGLLFSRCDKFQPHELTSDAFDFKSCISYIWCLDLIILTNKLLIWDAMFGMTFHTVV